MQDELKFGLISLIKSGALTFKVNNRIINNKIVSSLIIKMDGKVIHP